MEPTETATPETATTETATPQPQQPETPAADDADLMAAMDRGIEAATETPAEPATAAEVARTPEELAAEAAGKTPEQSAEEAAAKAKADAALKPDTETEKEITELGIKNARTAERFRELTGEVKASAPVMAAIKESGIPIEQLPSALKAASDHREWVQMVVDTGANGEQYAESLEMLALVTRAKQGDPEAAEAALASMAPVLTELAKVAGREVPGVFDPIDAHPDLKEAVEEGDMTRKAALEVVRARQVTASTRQQAELRTQADVAARAMQAGVNDLIVIDAEFLAQEGAGYVSKRPILNGIVQTIRETLPPSQWGAATRRAYAAIHLPATPVVANTPAPGHVPLRPIGSRANLQPEFDDPMAALEAGIAAAG